MKLFVVSAILLTAATASAANLPCSIRPEKGTPASKLPALATVTRADAENTALASIKAPATAKVTEGELEVEHGCLVYSFDIKIPGKSGVEEVMVDAGTGKAIAHEHESAVKEAAEKTAAKVKDKTHLEHH